MALLVAANLKSLSSGMSINLIGSNALNQNNYEWGKDENAVILDTNNDPFNAKKKLSYSDNNVVGNVIKFDYSGRILQQFFGHNWLTQKCGNNLTQNNFPNLRLNKLTLRPMII